jgi:carbamoyltransferase
MHILGISAFYHDSAAALISNGKIVAAAQEERFTRKKQDFAFPVNAIQYCLDAAGLATESLNYVVFYEKPLQKFDRLLETYLAFAPRGFSSFSKAIPQWLKQKLHLPKEIRKGLDNRYDGPLVFTEHHESHAASAFFPSPYETAAVVTIDGVGEWATASIGKGEGNKLEILQEMHFPHSIGLLYSAFTYYCGFRVNSGEYKLMGLAPYGKPRYVDHIRDNLLDIKDDGSLWMDMSYFNYCQGLTMTGDKFHQLFGDGPRAADTDITQKQMDMAASIQVVTEEVMLKMALHARELTGSRNLCLAGGVALNCVGNGKILASGEFDSVWIQPAAGDAGGALGAAMFVWHQLLERERTVDPLSQQRASLLGPQFNTDEIKTFLDSTDAVYHTLENEDDLLDRVAELIENGKVVGWFQDRMEFGPRALGARSIIGDARSERMQSIMNRKIKFRESFRPFAPSVLEEKAKDCFDLDGPSPYMLIVAPVNEARCVDLSPEDREALETGDLRERVHIKRSDIPAVTHIDCSARVQTVDSERYGRYYRLIKRFDERTACPVIINTSFNIRGEPIVGAPKDAYNCFVNTEMDILVLENCILYKDEQKGIDAAKQENYREEFPLD